MTSCMLDEEGSYSGEDDDYGLGNLDGSSQHSQDWQEQQQLYDLVQLPAGEGGQGGHPAESQQLSTSSARRGKRKGAYTEEERRYRRRLANRCVPSLIPARFRHVAQRHGHVFDLKIVWWCLAC